MKPLLLILLSVIPFILFGQDFSSNFIFKNTTGKTDTIIVGYSSIATDSLDIALGEINIPDGEIDTNFSVYASNVIAHENGKFLNPEYRTKKQLLNVKLNALPICIDVICKDFPLTIKWDKLQFQDTSRSQSFIIPGPPGGWFDVGVGPLFLRTVDSVVFSQQDMENWANYYTDSIHAKEVKVWKLYIGFANAKNTTSLKEWAPVGSKWHFNKPSSESRDFVVFESTKDTAIQGKSSHILEVKMNGTVLISKEYISQSKDSIFYFNANTNRFHLLYDFAAKIGDTIVVHKEKFKPTKAFFSYYDSINSFKYKVIAIDSIQISCEWFRRQKVEYLENSSWGFTQPSGGGNDYILDKFGSITYFFGVFPAVYPEQNISILRCYNEAAFEYKNPAWDQDCDIVADLEEKIPGTNSVQIYPNPCNNQLFINISESILSIDIYNINGLKTVSTGENNGSMCLDISGLKQGLYFLRIKTKHCSYIKKIIKN